MFRQLLLLGLASVVLCQKVNFKNPPPVVDESSNDDSPQEYEPPTTVRPLRIKNKKVPVPKTPQVPDSPQGPAPINPYESLTVDELLKRPLDTEALQQIMIRAQPGKDFPTYSLDAIPQTSFSCANVHQPGFYADIETGCQVFHFCPPSLEGLELERQTYICPNMSVFNNRVLVCDWFFNVDCKNAESLYDLANSRLYQTALPLLDDVPDVMEGNSPQKPVAKPKTQRKKPVKPVVPYQPVTTEASQEQYDAEQ